MSHIPRPETSMNGWCPNCKIQFGLIMDERGTACPRCNTQQLLPVIQTGSCEYHCFQCRMTFGSVEDAATRCPTCGTAFKTGSG